MLLNILEKEIEKFSLYEGKYIPEIVKAIIEATSSSIDTKIKMALAISEIILFISQFRINIKHWNESIIPINSITFCVAPSGAAKDSSLRTIRSCFSDAYNFIQSCRKKEAIQNAIQLATDAHYDFPTKYECYKEFYEAPVPLFISLGTPEGFTQHLNDLTKYSLGSGFISSSELGSDLISDSNLPLILKDISILYDMGCKEIKIIKNRETQAKEITSFPVSATFLGSGDNIIFDHNVKQRFKIEFTTKLARRSFFVFSKEKSNDDSFTSIDDYLANEREQQDRALEIRKDINSYTKELAEYLFTINNTYIHIQEDTRDLFELYKKYNEALADTIDIRYPITKLSRYHLQWKALKLAGALALIQGYDSITVESYLAAMEFNEYISNDILLFEKELLKEPYELFVDYMHTSNSDTFEMSLHDLKKSNFISGRGPSMTQLKELTRLANSYDKDGIYKCNTNTNSIEFSRINRKDTILLSYVPCIGTKQERRYKCDSGYITEEIKFSDLGEMLLGDYAYSPFRFSNGHRSKDNIDSGCKWLVLDIDTSEISDEECHLLLDDLNHYVVRTSDKNNKYKYRVLLELDAEVNLNDRQWSIFRSAIVEDLGLTADPVPKSQIYFSYSNRDILATLDGSPLETKPYLDILINLPVKKETKLTLKAKNNLLNDPYTTFNKAFDASMGEGSRKLIWAAKYARELGATKSYTLNLINSISNYWVCPLEEHRLEVLLNQVSRWEGFTNEEE